MSPEEKRKPDVSEAPEQPRAETEAVELAQANQAKSDAQQEREADQEQRRRRGYTPSSSALPAVFLDRDGTSRVVRRAPDVPLSGEAPGHASKPRDLYQWAGTDADYPPKAPADAPPEPTVTLDVVRVVGEYVGEPINRQLEPQTVNNPDGRLLTDIAREHLGAGATDDEVRKHLTEIVRLNWIQALDVNTPLILGQPLRLPGHTGDGGFITMDRAGNKRTVWDDGTVRIENKDGTGSTRKWQGEGKAYKENHRGPDPEDNYELRRTEDGKYEVAEADTENFRAQTNEEADLRVERARLKDLADERIIDVELRAAFEADMDRFEKRSKTLEEMYVKEGMSREDAQKMARQDVAKTYQELARILEHKGDKPIPEDWQRARLARQVLHHAADPTTVNQGQHPTCAVAALESRLYTRNPAQMAQMMAAVITTGEYTTKGDPPVTVKIDRTSLQAQGDEARLVMPGDQGRDYAGQIAQVTLANIAWERDNIAKGTPGRMRYEQREESLAGTRPPDDGGRVVDYQDPQNPKVRMAGKVPETHPAVHDGELLGICNDVTGQSEKGIVVMNTRLVGNRSDFVGVGSAEELKEKLEGARKDGKFPLLIHVHTRKEPFWSDSNAGKAGGSGGHHMISITDYDPVTGKVSVDNQWGKSADHFGNDGVPVADLYKATTSVYEDLMLEIEANRKSGGADAEKELELVEMARLEGRITAEDYEEAVVSVVLQSETRWQDKEDSERSGLEAQERQAEVGKVLEFINSMPTDERQELLKRLDQELEKQKKARAQK